MKETPFSRMVRRTMEHRGLRLVELAELTDIPLQVLSNYLNCRRSVSMSETHRDGSGRDMTHAEAIAYALALPSTERQRLLAYALLHNMAIKYSDEPAVAPVIETLSDGLDCLQNLAEDWRRLQRRRVKAKAKKKKKTTN